MEIVRKVLRKTSVNDSGRVPASKCWAMDNEKLMLCIQRGLTLYSTDIPSTQASDLTDVVPTRIESTNMQVRPWVRFWARMIDISLLFIVVVITTASVAPNVLDENAGVRLLGLTSLLAWMFIESFFLSTTGTTPGKWFLKTQLTTQAGHRPTYSSILTRSFKILWRGLGLGLPLVSLITLIMAYEYLTKNRITSWDKDGGFIVVHHRIGPLRVIVVATLFLAILALIVVDITTIMRWAAGQH